MSEQAQSSCRALVPLAVKPGATLACVRPDAAFLTQMLAHALGLPAQRARRRSHPVVASTLYRAGIHAEKNPLIQLDRKV